MSRSDSFRERTRGQRYDLLVGVWLAEEVRRADASCDLAQVRDTRQQHDRHVLEPHVVEQHLIGHLGPAEQRHLDVEEGERRRTLTRELEALLSVVADPGPRARRPA